MKKYICATVALSMLLFGCKSSQNNNKEHDHEGEKTEEYSNLSSCSGGHDHSKHAKKPVAEPVAHKDEVVDEIVFPVQQASLVDFAVEEIVPTAFSQVIKCSGEILSAQGDVATITAPVSGVVSLSGIRLSEGGAVSAHTPIFYVSSRNLASGDVFAKLEAQYLKAKADYNRAKSLVADKIISQKDFDQAEMDFRQITAEYSAIADRQSVKGTSVSSPIGGYVTSLLVSDGDFVEVGAPLATISQNKRLKLRAELSQKYSNKIGEIRSANFRSIDGKKVYSLSNMNGKLLSAGRSAASGSTLIPVTFEFDNRDNIVQGVFVEVYLIGAPVSDAVTVPVSAVTEQQGSLYVYVQLDEEGYQRREVTLAGSDGERVQVLSGVKMGERVVTRGAVNVKMAAASGAIPAGHNH